MKFTLSSTTLSSRLQALARVINSKNSLPILNCFLFEVREGKLFLTASDSENVIRTSVELTECEGEGRFCLTNKTILDAVKELSEEPLTFEVNLETMNVAIYYHNGKYNVTAQNAEEYPETVPVSENATVLAISADVLNDGISRSLFATATDELRPVMNGLYFDLKADNLTIVASDGHKLVRNEFYTIQGGENPAAFILPKKPATLLKGMLPKEGEVVLSFDERNAEVNFGENTITCRLIEGKYPNYNSVIPQDNPNEITIDRQALLSAIKRVLVFASQSSYLVRFHVEYGQLTLSSEDIDYATSANENIVCQYEGQPMSIGFKGTSLVEILGNIEGQEVVIKLADPSRAGVIVPAEQPDNENVLMLIMPMLLND